MDRLPSAFTWNVSTIASKVKGALDEKTKSFENHINEYVNKDRKVEDQAFLEKPSNGANDAVAPWSGFPNEGELRQQILMLSKDRRVFTIDPPTTAEFDFDLNIYYPIADVIMQQDPDLVNMRFELVPKKIKEAVFWKNYFYRIALLKQAAQLQANEIGVFPSNSSEQPIPSVDEGKGKAPIFSRTEAKKQKQDASNNDPPTVVHAIETHSVRPATPGDVSSDVDWETELQNELQNMPDGHDSVLPENWESEMKEILGEKH